MSTKTVKQLELREKAAELATSARADLESITDKTPPEQAKEIEARFDQKMADYDKAMEDADRMEKLALAEEWMNKGLHGNPHIEQKLEARAQQEKKAPEYRDAFYEMLKCGGDTSVMDPEVREVLRKGATEFRAQATTPDAAGGFTVPVELQNVLIETMKSHGPMYDPGITTEFVTTGGNKFQMPTIDDTGNTGAARVENSGMVDDGSGDAVFGRKEIDAFVYATPFIKWSMELSQDSMFNMENLLNTLIGKRLGRLANRVLTIGTGSGEPNGIVTASTAGITAASASAITSDELIDLFHSVDPAYRGGPNVRYMMNDQTLASVRKLKDGQGNYLWQMGNIVQGVPQSLNGTPISINQDMPGIAATNKSVLFGDFSAYYVRKVGAPVLGVMRERFWPDLGIAGLIRLDGELGDNSAIKALQQAA